MSRTDHILQEACGDYRPVLAIEDGRLADWVADCDPELQDETLEGLMQKLYPNQGHLN